MNYINHTVNQSNIKVDIFSAVYFLYVLNQILSQSNYCNYELFETLFKVVRWGLLVGMFLLIIINKKYPIGKKGLFWAVFASIGLIEMIVFKGGISLIMLFLVIVAARKKTPTNIIEIQLKAMTVGTLFVVLSGLFGIIELGIGYKTFDNITGFLFKKSSTRYNLGFTNSNVLPLIALYVLLYIILIKKNNYKRWYDIFAVAVNYFIYLLCGSRLCIVLVILAVILRNVIYSRENKFVDITYICCYISLGLSLFFSLILPLVSFFDSTIINRIDYFSTARISIMKSLLIKYPINMWGYGDIVSISADTYSIIDNGYLQLFITKGFMVGVLFIIIICMMTNFAKKENEPYFMLVILIMIIGNVVDNSLLHYVSIPLYIILFNSNNT